MTLTKTQIFHRTESLSGEIKAAREAQSECRSALADQERLTGIAAQAVERADARVAELEAERAELAEQARSAILSVGDPLTEPFNSVFAQPADLQAQGGTMSGRDDVWARRG